MQKAKKILVEFSDFPSVVCHKYFGLKCNWVSFWYKKGNKMEGTRKVRESCPCALTEHRAKTYGEVEL
jgi:hypothetical protein